MTIYLPGTELTVKSFQVRISDNYLPGTVKSLQVRISDNYLPGTVKSLHLTICPPVSTVRMFCTSMRRKPLFSNFHLFFIQSFFASRFTYLAQSNQILFGAPDLAIQIHVGVQCPIYLPGTDAPQCNNTNYLPGTDQPPQFHFSGFLQTPFYGPRVNFWSRPLENSFLRSGSCHPLYPKFLCIPIYLPGTE